jgi:hypothetical protein
MAIRLLVIVRLEQALMPTVPGRERCIPLGECINDSFPFN